MEYIVEETRRTGTDRRGDKRPPATDRRSVMNDQGKYLAIVQKIPVFKRLKLDQFRKILRICKQETVAMDDPLIISKTESVRMFILVSGLLRVVFDDGKELSRISPVQTVGEMGVFTGERRSASVFAALDSIVLSIHRKELMALFHNDPDLGICILANVITDLSGKLRKSNDVVEDLRKIVPRGAYTEIMKKKHGTSL